MSPSWARRLLVKRALMSTNHSVCKWCEKPLLTKLERRKAFHEQCLDEMLSELTEENTDEPETAKDDSETGYEIS
jgi:hypothetical protein